MEASDRRGRARRLFDAHNIAVLGHRPTFVRPVWTSTGSTRSRTRVNAATLEGAVRWLNYSVETELLMSEIEDSTARISTLVGAASSTRRWTRAVSGDRRTS